VIRRVRSSLSRLSGGLVFRLPVGLLLLLAASCSSTTDTTLTVVNVPTSLTIDPSSFLGSVACSNQPGALKSYVVTLREITVGKPAVELASSPPIPCSQPMSFRYVLSGHDYTVAIDGYDVPASALVPCGGSGSGSRYMIPAPGIPNSTCADTLVAGKVPVAPRFSTRCGDVASTPILNEDIVASCDIPLADSGASAPAGITIDPRASLGPLACVADGGTITRFDIKADDPAQTNHLGLDCATFAALDPQTFSYTKNLIPGATYTFHLGAHAANEPSSAGPLYTAECSVVARAGFTVPAVCGPFTQP
jgi:hypothetical protein